MPKSTNSIIITYDIKNSADSSFDTVHSREAQPVNSDQFLELIDQRKKLDH